MTRFTLHVPLQYNDGEDVDPLTFETIERELLTIADGFTRTEGIGAWQSPDGRLYREPVALYTLDVIAASPARSTLKSTADMIGHALAQESVYLTEIGADGFRAYVLAPVLG